MAAQGLLVPLVSKFVSDRAAAVWGAVGCAIFMALMGLAPTGIAYTVLALIWVLVGSINSASYNSLFSREVGQSDQGRLQGFARSLNAVVGLIAPGAYALMLAWGISAGGKPLSGAPFVVSGALIRWQP